MFQVVAPEAHKVRVRLGPGFDMAKEPDVLSYVTTTPQVVGFHVEGRSPSSNGTV